MRACLVLSTFSVNVAAVQEIHFTCAANCRVLENDYVVLSAYGSRSSVGVSLLIGRSLHADVNLVLADDGGRLVVANVAVKIFEFRVDTVYAPNIAAERVSFFWSLAPFLDNLKRIVLMGDLNAILDPKVDSVRRRDRGSRRCESSLIDFMDRHDLVDRFRLDHQVWNWLDSSPSVRTRSYLDRVLEELTLILLSVPRSTM